MATENINFITLEANQFNPEITYNSNLEIIDILLQPICISSSLTTPPPTPAVGELYVVGVGATGSWGGKDNYLAYYYNGWKFILPKNGWSVYDISLNDYIIWNTSSWAIGSFSSSFNSTNLYIYDNDDNTAKVQIDTSDVPTSTTISIKVPNSNYTLGKQNLIATTAPTSSDDSADGYSKGSLWINTSTSKGYLCVNNTAGAAVWKEIASATGSGDITGPVSSTINELSRFADTSGDVLKGSSVILTDNKELYSHHKYIDSHNINYTLIGTDSGKVITVDSTSPVTITLPQTSTESIPNGFFCNIIRLGSGTVTIIAQGSDALISKNSYTTISPRYGEIVVKKLVNGSPNTWILSGDLG